MFRATAGQPEHAQIMYGIAGERRLEEYQLDWLPGYEGSKPLRVGNAARGQFQLDVYGEVVEAIGLSAAGDGPGQLARVPGSSFARLLDYLASAWQEPDDGMWEARGPRRHDTQSKVMAWLAFDRAIALSKRFKLAGPVQRWEQVRAQIHDEILERAYDPQRHTFTQSYGSVALDAGVLMVEAGRPAESQPTAVSRVPSTRSAASLATTASSPATRRTSPTTAWRAARDSSLPARSG